MDPLNTYTREQVRQAVADEAGYLWSVMEFRHRVAAMLSLRADRAADLVRPIWADEYRRASLRAARDTRALEVA